MNENGDKKDDGGSLDRSTRFLQALPAWAAAQSDIDAVALVGSFARGDAREDSDIDLVIIAQDSQRRLQDTHWLEDFGALRRVQREDYGALISLRAWYADGREIEFGLTDERWAGLPLDPGTREVVAGGMKVLFERRPLLSRLEAEISSPGQRATPEGQGRDSFDQWANSYDQAVDSGDGFPFAGYEDVLNGVVRAAAAEPHHRVLDLGVGTGNLAVRFVALGCSVTGIDFSPKMLERAKEKVPDAQLVEADIRGPWPAGVRGPFDRIVSAYTFHHLDPAAKIRFLKELSQRWLAPDGRIVVGDVGFPSAESLVTTRRQQGPQWDDSEYYWVISETLAACRSIGLRVDTERVGKWGVVFSFQRAEKA